MSRAGGVSVSRHQIRSSLGLKLVRFLFLELGACQQAVPACGIEEAGGRIERVLQKMRGLGARFVMSGLLFSLKIGGGVKVGLK